MAAERCKVLMVVEHPFMNMYIHVHCKKSFTFHRMTVGVGNHFCGRSLLHAWESGSILS